MRLLDDHLIDGKAFEEEITALDEPGFGNASHEYEIIAEDFSQRISFQKGAIKEYGVNGISNEALLTIVIDRLRSFQGGDFCCRENAIALTDCEEALMWLQKRTRDRIKRGVEGRDIK